MFKNNIEFFIVLSTIFSFLIGSLFSHILWMRKTDKHNEELCRLIYSLLQKARVLDDNFYNIREIINDLELKINSIGSLETKNSNTISSLTSSISNMIQESRKLSEEKIYPTPQLSEMIGSTIDEFIRQEITMMSGMRIPVSHDSPVTLKITKNVIRTYPHVDEEYLARRVIQRLTEASRQ